MAEKIEKDKENNNNQDVINLSEIIFTLAKHIKLILFIPTIFCLLTILNVQFLVKPVFVSQAKIMSSSQTQSSQAAGIAARFGISIPEISGDVEWVYPEIVKSRKIARSMLKRKFFSEIYGKEMSLLKILNGEQVNENSSSYSLEMEAIDKFLNMILKLNHLILRLPANHR